MTAFNFSDKKDTNVVITRESFNALKRMDSALKRVIESMNGTIESINTFHYLVGEVLNKIKETDPSIDDDPDLT